MNSRLAGLNHHFILCGFGRVGREVARTFRRESVRFIVIDSSPRTIIEAEALGYLYVQGDASEDEILLSAGIKRARGLIAAATSDADNVFISLSARGLNRDLLVVARATTIENEDKLLRAGADRVISPHTLAGRRMALSALRPLVVDFSRYTVTTWVKESGWQRWRLWKNRLWLDLRWGSVPLLSASRL